MRDVFLKVMVVTAVMVACMACAQAAPKTKTTSAFDQLDDAQLMENLIRFGMHELVGPLTPQDASPKATLMRVRIQAETMRKLTDPAACVAKGKLLIASLEKAVDGAEKEMEEAEKAAEKATPQTRIDKLLVAAKAAYRYFDVLYFLGDLSGRQTIEPYARKVMYLQDNREDRKIILQMTEGAVLDLDDVQDELKDKLRDWQEQMSVWMIMGAQGENLLRNAQYWSTRAYLYRAMALGDVEAHESEREQIRGAFRRTIAHIPANQTASRQKLQAKLDKDLANLAADQKRRIVLRRELLGRVLMLLPKFEKNKRFNVTHDARRIMALAHRELGEYDKAIDKLAPQRYQGASGEMKMTVAMELPITLVKQGKYSEAEAAIGKFKGFAELVVGKGQKLNEIQQAQVDLKVAMLKDYLYRRRAAASTTPADKSRYNALGQAAMIEFLDKYKKPGIRQSFIDFFGNRLLYAEDIDRLSSVQLYIVASGAAASKDPDKRRAMLETIIGRKNDPASKKLAAPVHWQLAMAMNELGRNIDAADNFIAVVSLLGPDNPRAPLAAKNAAICMTKYVTWYETNKKKMIPPSVRLKCVEALKHAVSFDEKYPDLKLSEWYSDLGRHCNRLSQNCPAEEVLVWMQRAADAFGKVPTEPRDKYFEAQDLQLDIRYRALQRSDMDAKARATARKLREQCKQFIELVEKYIAGLPDKTSDEAKAQIQDLHERAAWADFTRAKLLSEQMGQGAAGLVEVQALQKKWTQVDSVVVAANQWEIQNLINLDRIEEASAKLQAFKKANEKRPDVWAGLIEQVIEGIRKGIDQALAKKGNEAKLASLRKNYLQLASILYAPIKGKPVEIGGKVDNDRLTLTQLWIDALVQNDKGAEALKLALEIRRIFDQRRKAQAKQIEDKYAPRIRACNAAVGLPKAIAKLVKDFKDELVQRSKDPGADDFNPEEDAAPVDMAYAALTAAPANTPADKLKRLMSAVSLELMTGYRDIIRRLKNRLPVNLTVEWNMAKCFAATGKYGDSLLIYLRLIKGTDPHADRDSTRRFWRLQLEYCQTYIKALGKEKERMVKLVAYIETELPRIGGDALGGFKVEFFAIREQARRLSQ